MVVALLVGAVKYVAMYVIAHKYRTELGSLSMLFWCQIFTMAFVVPWSIADGELHNLVSVASIKTQLWVFSAAGLGGVRFLSQILALGMMSPTSLSVVNVGAHLLVASIVLLAGIQTLPGKAGSLGMLISGLTVAVIGAHSHRTRLLRYDGPRTTRTPHAHHTHTPRTLHLTSHHRIRRLRRPRVVFLPLDPARQGDGRATKSRAELPRAHRRPLSSLEATTAGGRRRRRGGWWRVRRRRGRRRRRRRVARWGRRRQAERIPARLLPSYDALLVLIHKRSAILMFRRFLGRTYLVILLYNKRCSKARTPGGFGNPRQYTTIQTQYQVYTGYKAYAPTRPHRGHGAARLLRATSGRRPRAESPEGYRWAPGRSCPLT